MLPCGQCGRDLQTHLAQHPTAPHLETREGAVRWMIDLHNLVNKEAGKPVLSYEDALRATRRHTCGTPAQLQHAPKPPQSPATVEAQEAAPPASASRGRGARRRQQGPFGDPKLGAEELKGKLAHARELLAKMGSAAGGGARPAERGDAPRRQGPGPAGAKDLLGKLGGAKDLLAKLGGAAGEEGKLGGAQDLLGKLGGAGDLLAKLGGAAEVEGKLGGAQDLLAKLGGAARDERGAVASRRHGSGGAAGGELLGKLQGAKGLLGRLHQRAPPRANAAEEGPGAPAGADLLERLLGGGALQAAAAPAGGARRRAAAERSPDRVKKLVDDALPELLKVLEGSSGEDLQALAASMPQDVVKEALSVPAVRDVVGKALGGRHRGAHRAPHGNAHPDTQE
ncbi:unnamed protein product [Prorocentrum cordatum]|uniref:Sulfhydryl oxidase n=1 Tax=Prorocentrum cordatum TaxID=2364126 RepID=A0ABN9RL90_9DINO|nr:unnamed protein product [Polarella glacialis]